VMAFHSFVHISLLSIKYKTITNKREACLANKSKINAYHCDAVVLFRFGLLVGWGRSRRDIRGIELFNYVFV